MSVVDSLAVDLEFTISSEFKEKKNIYSDLSELEKRKKNTHASNIS